MVRLLLIVLVVFSLPGAVFADFCLARPPIVAQSYYVGPPVYVSPVVVQAFCPPVFVPPPCPPSAVGTPLAAPRAAPPSSQPPLRRMPDAGSNPALVPSVSEFQPTRQARSPALSTSFYRAYSYNPSEQPLPNGATTLTLSNGSGKALLVWIEGVRYLLVEGQSITREVGREFTWQAEGREKQSGQARPGERGVNIVIEH